MKKKAVMLAHRTHNGIQAVYNGPMLEQLKELVELYPEVIDYEHLQEHREALREADFVFTTWGMYGLTEEEVRYYFPKLKAIYYAAGSVQHFARAFLANRIEVVSAWAANSIPVAEYAVAQILLANKGILRAMTRSKSDHQDANRLARRYPGNYSTKVGILGAGMIGRKVIELLAPYRLELYVCDPYLSDEQAEAMGVRKTGLEAVFAECQTISNHIASLPETVGLLNKSHFNRMLPYATFINTGRGAQVVEQDLIQALRTVPTRTAILDVTDPEPPIRGSELLQ